MGWCNITLASSKVNFKVVSTSLIQISLIKIGAVWIALQKNLYLLKKIELASGPDQPCARPEATVAARPLKKTATILTRPTWPISSHLWVGRGSEVGGQGNM